MGLKEKLIAKLWALLQGLIEKYGDFIKKPLAYKAIMLAAGLVVGKLVDWLKSLLEEKINQQLSTGLDDTLQSVFGTPGSTRSDGFDDRAREYVRRHPGLRQVENYMDRDLSESHIGDITLACTDPDYYDGVLENLMDKLNIPSGDISGEDYLNYISGFAGEDFEDKVSIFESIRPGLAELLREVDGILPWVFLVYIIFLQVQEFLDQNEWPSKYRGKYLAKRIRLAASILRKAASDTATDLKQASVEARERAKNRIDDVEEQAVAIGEEIRTLPGDVVETGRDIVSDTTSLISSLTNGLKSLDSVIGGVLLASLIYEYNRRMLQEEALEEFGASAKNILCIPSDEVGADGELLNGSPFPSPSFENSFAPLSGDASITLPADLIGFTCPVPLGEEIVPHQPLEEAEESFSCPIPVDTYASLDSLGLPDSPAPYLPLATSALYTSLGSDTLTPIPEPGDLVTVGDPLWNVSPTKEGNKPYIIYSAVAGRVSSISSTPKPEMLIEDISVPDESQLQKTLKDLQDLYADLSDTKLFLQDWYIRTIKPVLLSVCPTIDGSLSATDLGNITYWTGGIQKRYEKALKDSERIKEEYENNASNIAGSDNVKGKLGGGSINPQATEDTVSEVPVNSHGLLDIKRELEIAEEKYYKELKGLGTKYTNQAKQTRTLWPPIEKEYILWEWYEELLNQLDLAADTQTDLETRINNPQERRNSENRYLSEFTAKIREFSRERYFIEETGFEALTEKFNSLCQELDRGEYLRINAPESTYWKEAYLLWERATEGRSVTSEEAQDYTKTLLSWASSLGKKNENISTEDKNLLRLSIYRTWEYAITVSIQEVEEYEISFDPFTQTEVEGSYLSEFFNNLWRKLSELPKKIDEKLLYIDKIGRSSIVPSIINRSGIDTYLYAIGDSRECPLPSYPDERLSPFSQYEFGDLPYWLKYCGFATLASIASLPPNWGTGFPPPLSIPFPTVYIPIKAFQLDWGTLVIGITLTGIYPFPWVMVANLSTGYHVPLVDPATIIKRNIDVLKSELKSQLANFRGDLIDKALDDIEDDISYYLGEINRIETAQTRLRENKPKRNRAEEALGDRVKALREYSDSLAQWNITRAALAEEMISTKKDLFIAETKWDILNSAKGGGSVEDTDDPKIQSIAKVEKSIDKQFERLKGLVDKIDPLLRPLPIALAGGTASFFFTLKNPKPLQGFNGVSEGDLNEQINTSLLERLQKPFELQRSDLMSSSYGSKIRSSYINGSAYLSALAASSIALIPVDPFPKYEMLKFTNLSWTLKFLLRSWAPTGGGQYGFPGFPKLPL